MCIRDRCKRLFVFNIYVQTVLIFLTICGRTKTFTRKNDGEQKAGQKDERDARKETYKNRQQQTTRKKNKKAKGTPQDHGGEGCFGQRGSSRKKNVFST